MYAIVKTGGKQYKVAEGDVITVEKLAVEPGATVNLTPLLVVDGESRTLDAEGLAAASVTAEVVAQTKGPKIKIHKYKNKTGYHKRMGHRQRLTEVKITSVLATSAADPAVVETPGPAETTPAAETTRAAETTAAGTTAAAETTAAAPTGDAAVTGATALAAPATATAEEN